MTTTDLASKVHIVENSDSAKEDFDTSVHSSAATNLTITKADIDALLSGKCLAIYDGEYTTYLTYEG